MSTDPHHEPSTRTRILHAAIDVFAAVGFAGARVDAIAKRAGCNKQLLYHHFRDKEGLYRSVFEAVLSEKSAPVTGRIGEMADIVAARFRKVFEQRRWVRLLQWEALDRGGEPLVSCAEREQHLAQELATLRGLQKAGHVRDDVDAELLLMQIIGLVMVPAVLPQLVRLVTGSAPESPEFADRYAEALRASVVNLLRPPGPSDV